MKFVAAFLLSLLLAGCAADGDNQVTTHVHGFYSSGFSGVSK
jgi:hypothetical protein